MTTNEQIKRLTAAGEHLASFPHGESGDEEYLCARAEWQDALESAVTGDPSPTIHHWFELSYASYLTIPRSVLQSMPTMWQRRLTRCLVELDRAIDWRPKAGARYRVGLFKVDEAAEGDEPYWGEELSDPLDDYNRGRRRMPYKCPACGSAEPDAQVCNRCRKLAADCTCLDQEAIKAGHCRRIPCPSPLHPENL